jgi:diguanylate cyclase (GGDEF)-like protein/PAS domain S-box-containing protein
MKNYFIRFFRGFSLRQRFSVAPLLGLVVCSLLTAAFIYESQRQNALLRSIAERDLTAFNRYSEVFGNLTEQHMQLDDLFNSAAKFDEATLYDRAKQHIYKFQEGVDELEQALPPMSKSEDPDFAALRNELSANVQTYRKVVGTAVGMATVNLALVPEQIARADERFNVMNRTFVRFLDFQRRQISFEIAARVRQSTVRNMTIAFFGVSIAALLFFLSLVLSKILSRSIETQIGMLTDLGAQAGPRSTVEDSNEVERMTQAIAAFRQSLLELRESERRFSDLLRNVELASVMLDGEARITFCNEYLLRLTGWRHEEVIGRNWFELFIPSQNNDVKDFSANLLANVPEGWHRENEILTRSGEPRLMRWNNSVLRSIAGDVIGSASIGEDITEQKRAEIGIKRLTRVHAVLSGINAAIVRIRDRQELFRESCRIAVEAGQLRLAWIGVIDAQSEMIVPAAFSGPEEGFLQLIRLSTRENSDQFGLAGRAILDRVPAVSNDVLADERMRFRRRSAQRGFRSLAMIPLIVDGAAIGVLGLHAAEAGFFNQDEMKLVMEIAGNIDFALEHLDKQEKVRRLTRVQAVLSGINTLIVRVRDRDELFREACRIAVEHGQFKTAWIGVVDRNAMKIVPVASAGSKPDYMEFIKAQCSLVEESPMDNTMIARAIREKKASFSNDTQNDPRILFKKEHVESGIRSIVVLPLLISGEAVGLLALYADETGFFDEEEMKLLTELAGDIAFAIDHIDKQERLDYLAYYDALTGLANRSLFLERVAQFTRSAAGGGHKLALFLFDLERFKNINDSLGRPAGDALLRQVAEWLTRNLGDANLFARVDADHFAIVLPQVELEGDVARLVEKSMQAFLHHQFRLNDAVFRIAAKVGIALFPDDGADADTLFRNAEAALKKAKASGDRYLFHTQTMTEAVAGKLTLENQLRQALDKEEFVLHYQPKVNLASGKLTSAEALIRWNDPRTGLVPPGRFIPILEETGLIYDVGRWALRKAIEDYLRWRAAGLAAVRIAVNVSPLQLRNRGFVAEVRQAIGIDAHAAAGLELEITESLIMEDVKHSIASLQAIRAMGVTIAIDDFGTGFSSLSYLAKLPVDTLKIDRSFVIDMKVAPEGLALVSTIITLAHSLKLKVVAEGVETEEQSRLLRLLNCDEMQGFLFSKPVPGEIFETRFLAPPLAG